MKKRLSAPLVAGLLLALAAIPARAQEDGYPFRFSNFSLEFFGGRSSLRPDDLNGFVDYEQAWLQFYFVQQFEYLKSLSGGDFSYTSRATADSAFRKLDRATPFGARLRYQASPTFSLSIGVEFLDAVQASNVGMAFDVTDRRVSTPESAASAAYQYLNPGFELRVRGWRPTFGAHFGWDLLKALRSEIFIDFGPLFTKTTAVSDRRLTYSEAGGYHWESGSKTEMSGSQTSLCGEMGTALMVRLAGFLQLCLEASYSFREPGELEGPGASLETFADSTGAQSRASRNWTGLWSFQNTDIKTAWGRFTYIRLQNEALYGYINDARPFGLDLSGFQLKAGFKFNF